MKMMNDQFKLFALPNSLALGEAIAKKLKRALSPTKMVQFADGEIMMSPEETVRNCDVFVVASTCPPVNDNLMQLLIFVDALKRASAKTITVALTYYGYSRQDRKAQGRQPIAAKLVADLLETAGVTKIISVDLHNPSIQGFFDIPVDDLKGIYILAPEVKKIGKFTIVSPDHGGANRARYFAELVAKTVNIAIVDKRRTSPNSSEVMNILGDVSGKNLAIVDDMIDTGGTIIKAAVALKAAGAAKIIVVATHGLFSQGFDKLEAAHEIDKIIVSDSISSVRSIKSSKLIVISLDEFIAATIKATVEGTSITHIYDSIKKKI